MVQAPDISTIVRECVVHSKAANQIREENHYSLDKPLDTSTVEKLYSHGNCLLSRYNDLKENGL